MKSDIQFFISNINEHCDYPQLLISRLIIPKLTTGVLYVYYIRLWNHQTSGATSHEEPYYLIWGVRTNIKSQRCASSLLAWDSSWLSALILWSRVSIIWCYLFHFISRMFSLFYISISRHRWHNGQISLWVSVNNSSGVYQIIRNWS